MALSLDEALELISVVPLEVRRHQELLHTLDVRWIGHMTDLRKAHETYIKGVRARAEKLPKDGSVDVRRQAGDEKDLAAVMALSADCRQVSEEKVSVAQQSQETVTSVMAKLEVYLRDFEEELRQSGELNDEVFEETQSEAGDDPYEAQYAQQPRTQQTSHRAGGGGGAGRPAGSRGYVAPQAGAGQRSRDAAFAFSPSGSGRADDALAYSAQGAYNKAGGGAAAGGMGAAGFKQGGGGGSALSPTAEGLGAGGGFAENAELEDQTPYCLCQKPQYGEMIGCENAACPHGEWFHMYCVALTAAPKGIWYCPPCRKALTEAAERAPKKSHHRKGPGPS